jgi:hypothetical protein
MTRPIADDLRVNARNLVRCAFDRRLRQEMVAWKQLVLAARGAEDTATELVRFELDRSPWLTRAEAIAAAARRLEADRSR